MKPFSKFVAVLILALCPVIGLMAEGFEPFDPCTTPASPIKYKEFHLYYYLHDTISNYTEFTETTYAAVPNGVKLVKYFSDGIYGPQTNYDGAVMSYEYFYTYIGGYYGCGFYSDELVNRHLSSEDVSDCGEDCSLAIEENHSATHYSVTFTTTSSSGSVVAIRQGNLDGAYVPGNEVNDGKDNASCQPSSCGMPVWFVTEPYINLWIKDTPVFYNTSLGERIDFEVSYKQRDTRPTDTNVTAVPITGWQHNWFSYFSFQVPTKLTGKNTVEEPEWSGIFSPRGAKMWVNWIIAEDYNQWQGILYATDGGENYFDHAAATETDSGLKIIYLGGSGFKLIHPDGSQDIYGLLTPVRPVYGPAERRGEKFVHALGTLDIDSTYTESWSTNDYTEFDNTTDAAPIGSILGYKTREALLTERIDPYGNSIHLTYDTNYHLTEIIDYDDRTNTLVYTDGRLTRVNMAYGRRADFGYSQGFLTSITDAEEMTSYISYTNATQLNSIIHGEQYRTNYAVASLITPYGTNLFEHTEAPYFMMLSNPPTLRMVERSYTNWTADFTTEAAAPSLRYVGRMGGLKRVNRAIKITNPDGSHELYAYRYDSAGLVSTNYPTNQIPYSAQLSEMDDGLYVDAYTNAPIDTRLTTRNSFYWNRQQTALITNIVLTNITASQIALARMSHWLAASDNDNELSESVSLVRAPSPDGVTEGAKTWFDYSGKSARWKASGDGAAQVMARVMPDGNVAYQKTYFSGGLLSSITETYTEPDGDISPRTYNFDYEDAAGWSGAGSYTYKRLNQITWPGGGSLTRQFSAGDLRMDQVDSLDNTNTVFFNSRYQVVGVKYANGSTTTNLYGADGFLSKRIAVEAGATNTYQFANGLLATNTSPLGLTTSYTWDKLDRLLKIKFPDNTTIENQYDKLDLVRHTDRLGKLSYAGYDRMRQLLATTNANYHVTQYSWCTCGALESVTDPLNRTTTFNRNNNGHVTSTVMQDGFTTTYHRDIFGRVTNLTSSAGLDLDYAYDIQGLVVGVTNPAGTVFAATYDVNDLPIHVTDSRGISVTNTFDALGRLLTRQNALGHTETFTYSAQGLFQHTDPLSRITSYGYDPAGRLSSVTNANEEVTQFGYNPVGELTSLTDGRNNTKRWAYDIYGRQIAETNAAGVLVKTNGYDANSRLTRLWTAAKGLTQLAYDPNGNLTNIVQPNSGTISYAYDALDRLVTFNSGIGSSALDYTNWGAFQGALATEDGPWGSDTVNYRYANHKFTSIGLGSWTNTIGYDAALRPESFTSTSAGTFIYAFNGASRQVDTLTMPHNTVTHDYDDIGALMLKQLRYGGSSGTVLDSRGYAYDPVGLITNITRLNGVKADYGYDPIGQLISAQAFESGGAPRLNEQLGYAYDASHNLAFRTNNTLLQSFTSNSRNELANAVRAGTLTVSGSVTGAVASVGVNGTRAAIYSDGTFATTNGLTLNDGNNLFVTVGTNTGGTLVLSTKVATKLPATVNFNYDLNGNLLSDGLKGFDYDDANQLLSVTVANGWRSEFVYDGLGRRRIGKEYSWSGSAWSLTNEVRYVWDGMCVLQERDGANTVQVTYTRGLDLSGTMQGAGGIGGLLARTDSGGTKFYHSDAGGNITAMTDSSGNVVARYLYDPFGNLLAKSGPMADVNRYRFSSKEIHPNSGLYYYGYRFYEPNLQRWMNEDPIGIAGGINVHRFVGNDPLNTLDPNGEVVWYKPWTWADPIFEGPLATKARASGKADLEAMAQRNYEKLIDKGLVSPFEHYDYETFQKALGVNEDAIRTAGDLDDVKTCGDTLKYASHTYVAVATSVTPTAAGARCAVWTTTKSSTATENAFRHFADHGAEFGAKNAVDYVRQTRSFLHNPPPGTLTKIRPNGDVVRYEPVSNTFGVMDATGAPRTMFKPTPRSPSNPTGYDPQKYSSPLEYFNAQ